MATIQPMKIARMRDRPDAALALVIPTNRPMEVSATVKAYSESFTTYGHCPPIMVFDNSPMEIDNTTTHALRTACGGYVGPVFYVGWRHRSSLVESLTCRFPSEASILQRLFGANYGGSRNLGLLYTLGSSFFSVDDDIRPQGIFLPRKDETMECLAAGWYMTESSDQTSFVRSQDIWASVEQLLGKGASCFRPEVPRGYDVCDSDAPDPTRNRHGKLLEFRSTIVPGAVEDYRTVRLTQTHLTGDTDVEAEILLNEYINSGSLEALAGKMPKKLALTFCSQALLRTNSRLTGAVMGLDNSAGALYFLPTKLRCEDFIWRLYLARNQNICCAYTDSAQTHTRSALHRPSVLMEWLNDRFAWALFRQLISGVRDTGEHFISFDENIDVAAEAREIVDLLRFYRSEIGMRLDRSLMPAGLAATYRADLLVIEERQLTEYDHLYLTLKNCIQTEINIANAVAKLWPNLIEYVG